MGNKKDHVCPVKRAGRLDNRFRKWLQDPQKILGPYIEKGMTVLDLGCGPGFLSVDIARMVGESGKVIASDLQEGMLEKLRNKIQETELEDRIILHKCTENTIGLSEKIDFAVIFYVVHEIPDQQGLFVELESMLNPGGQVLVVEPPVHVSKSAFRETILRAQEAGFKPEKGPKVFLSKTVILRKANKTPAE